jgi:hypothetical protein
MRISMSLEYRDRVYNKVYRQWQDEGEQVILIVLV